MKITSARAIAILLFIFCVSLSGALIFIKGFLLSRTVLDNKSQCEVDFALKADDHPHHGSEGCWMHGRFKRAVILIIDALKYDFMRYDSVLNSKNGSDIPPFKNKLTTIHHLLKQRPLNSRMYTFLADPPTTTMQRLKGLTTGSLPTFVDAGANFQSSEITEDNIIDKMIQMDKKIKFFGDDTWMGLFPKRFYKSFPFPSFDVKDLHTVDNGILSHIYPQMRRSDWDVIIAHFLGVDHCGHRYGPNHPAMADKLSQMDAVLRNVTQLLRDDTVLFVMGDHGMTRTGDHGGDSPDELEAGLFVYSPVQLTSSPQSELEESTVRQTDIVPTVALLMGLPIPFSNLGMVIPELFSHCPWWDTATNQIRQVYHMVKALRLNAHQIHLYLTAYQEVASDLSRRIMDRLQQQLNEAESQLQSLITGMVKEGTTSGVLKQFLEVQDIYKVYIRGARELCESVWAKFDLQLIVIGLLTITLGLVLGIYFLLLDDDKENIPISGIFLLGGALLHLLYLIVHFSVLPDSVPPLMAFMLAVVLIVSALIVMKNNVQCNLSVFADYCTVENLMASVILCLNCCCYFSNSYVIHEDTVTLFSLQTMLLIFGLKIVVGNFQPKKENTKHEFHRSSKKFKSNFDIMQVLTHPSVITICVSLILCITLRVTLNFCACREEEHGCEDSVFLLPLTVIEWSGRNYRYVISVISLITLVLVVRYWLKFYGNMNGTTAGVMAMTYGPPLAVVFTVLHWAVQALPDTAANALFKWQQVLMAQAVYIIVLVALGMIIASPLLLFTLLTKTKVPSEIPRQASAKQIIPTLYNQLKVRFSDSKGNLDEKPPMVYGLGTVYSSSVVAMVTIVSHLLVLLLNDGLAPAWLLATLSLYLCLQMYSGALASCCGRQVQNGTDEICPGPSWCGMVTLTLLSTMFFYATGHEATIPNIRFEAAYTGFYGDFNSFFLPGFLVWMNTFAGLVFFSLASPLLAFWPALSSTLVASMVKRLGEQQGLSKSDKQGDFKLFNNSLKLRRSLFRVCCGLIVISSAKMLSAACAAALHRRHLMVWKIFAPRFVYEGAMFLTTSVCATLAFLFILRVDQVLSKFVSGLPSKNQE